MFVLVVLTAGAFGIAALAIGPLRVLGIGGLIILIIVLFLLFGRR